MKRAARTNLILIFVVAALGLAVYWQVNKEVTRFEPPLSALMPEQINNVTVSCLQCVARRFERVEGHWSMREPYNLPADDAQLVRLLSIATSAVRSRRAFSSLNAKKIGLDPPLISLDLGPEHFDIGTTDAFNGDRYVRVGDTIAMVPDRFSPFLVAAPPSEIDRHLLPRGSALKSLKINDLDRPELIEAWTHALAARITARTEDSSKAEGVVVELTLGDGSLITYRIVRDNEGGVARRSEPALNYVLSAEQVGALVGGSETRTH